MYRGAASQLSTLDIQSLSFASTPLLPATLPSSAEQNISLCSNYIDPLVLVFKPHFKHALVLPVTRFSLCQWPNKLTLDQRLCDPPKSTTAGSPTF